MLHIGASEQNCSLRRKKRDTHFGFACRSCQPVRSLYQITTRFVPVIWLWKSYRPATCSFRDRWGRRTMTNIIKIVDAGTEVVMTPMLEIATRAFEKLMQLKAAFRTKSSPQPITITGAPYSEATINKQQIDQFQPTSGTRQEQRTSA